MTRINLEHPSLLCREHLTGEWYENPRIATNILKASGKVDLASIPGRFTVRTNSNPNGGVGHMKFFYNKLAWLRTRYLSLMEEMKSRGYSPSDNWKIEIFSDDYRHLFNDWIPDDTDVSLSRTRIAEMMPVNHNLTDDQMSVMRSIKEYEIIFKK